MSNKDLTERWLHQVMVFFNKPAGWNTIAMSLLLAILSLPVMLLWRLTGRRGAGWAAAVQALFMLFDMALFRHLPRRAVSFGPWQSQTFVLGTARLAAAAPAALLKPLLGPVVSLAALLGGQLVGTALLIYGALIEPARVRLTRLEIPVREWPAGAPPLRVLHISDLHVERLAQREEDVVRLTAEAQPDLILFTGDYVNLSYNEDPITHEQVALLLAKFEAPYGVYAVLGSPPVDLREAVLPIFARLPIDLLRHDCRLLDLGHGRELVILGMDCHHDIECDSQRLAELVAKVPAGVPRVLLYHSPEIMPEAARQGIDLYLCGHTHGGQVRLPYYGAVVTSSDLGKRYEMGHYREGRTHLYVSRGVGFEGLSAPRVRFLSPPEITLITLRPYL